LSIGPEEASLTPADLAGGAAAESALKQSLSEEEPMVERIDNHSTETTRLCSPFRGRGDSRALTGLTAAGPLQWSRRPRRSLGEPFESTGRAEDIG